MTEQSRSDGTKTPLASQILLFAGWLAGLTWLTEVAVQACRRFALAKLNTIHPVSVLLGPVAYLLLFMAVAAVLIGLALGWRRLRSPRIWLCILLFLAFGSIVLLWERILGDIAALILALGLAVQTARWITGHQARLMALARRTIVPMWLLIAITSAVPWSVQYVQDRFAHSRLPPPPEGATNVLLIILDTVRASSMSLYGAEKPTTPKLERWAAHGVVFDRAFSTSSWTLTSHASLFTGLLPSKLGISYGVPVEWDGARTLAEVLSGTGYETIALVANLYYTSRQLNLDPGFGQYEDFPASLGQLVLSFSLGRAMTNNPKFRRLIGADQLLNRKTAARINDDFLRWLSRDRERPFFAFLNYYDAHEPYVPPEPFKSRFAREGELPTYEYDSNIGTRPRLRGWQPSEVSGHLGAYEGTVAYLDHHIARLLDDLDQLGHLDNTFVIITSDHGEAFAEHGILGHTYDLHSPVLHVPLILFPPGVQPKRSRIPSSVSLADIPATIADVVRLQASSRDEFPGTSLAPLWQHESGSVEKGPSIVVSEITSSHPAKSVLIGTFHYLRGVKDGEVIEQLYDLSVDPLETIDLAPETSDELLRTFRAALAVETTGKSEWP